MKISDEMVESAARWVFMHWQFQRKNALPVSWVSGGNSEKQDDARAYALAALEAVAPAIRALEAS